MEVSGPPFFAAFFVRDVGGTVGEPFVALKNFLGQVRICNACFISTWDEPEKVVLPVERQ